MLFLCDRLECCSHIRLLLPAPPTFPAKWPRCDVAEVTTNWDKGCFRSLDAGLLRRRTEGKAAPSARAYQGKAFPRSESFEPHLDREKPRASSAGSPFPAIRRRGFLLRR